ncbi:MULTISPECIES: aryl-alcohol dehydrogenase [unclassified Lactobacillus]|uniref:aryl-alcohol dehydrogenase n=1 Tax=unclassified Lactobacillus TaxID=2620435 RepID=UPI0018DB3E53|nr:MULTISPECIES: aryl-alcohol dehydrogenase [unclassified Lactobacillus]MBH9990082.1 aryl-alcohol dehydrogenase [Lactobacillus sp. M0392]MBI0024587.1 aryl-alcohol dehydrogenase [Lactobacillus sp. W8171]MBI0045230.1 aryl-alcohol dehydrogenase [Lactobacillus sp. M0393]
MINLLSASKSFTGVIEVESVPQEFIPEMVDLYRSCKFPLAKMVKFYQSERINEAIRDSVNGSTIKPIIVFDEKYK